MYLIIIGLIIINWPEVYTRLQPSKSFVKWPSCSLGSQLQHSIHFPLPAHVLVVEGRIMCIQKGGGGVSLGQEWTTSAWVHKTPL